MSDKQGIEIDYCPQCRGVWLDRGELDKIVERSASWSGGSDRDDDNRRAGQDDDRPRSDRKDEKSHKSEKPKKSKSKSFFETIMESVGEP